MVLFIFFFCFKNPAKETKKLLCGFRSRNHGLQCKMVTELDNHALCSFLQRIDWIDHVFIKGTLRRQFGIAAIEQGLRDLIEDVLAGIPRRFCVTNNGYRPKRTKINDNQVHLLSQLPSSLLLNGCWCRHC